MIIIHTINFIVHVHLNKLNEKVFIMHMNYECELLTVKGTPSKHSLHTQHLKQPG